MLDIVQSILQNYYTPMYTWYKHEQNSICNIIPSSPMSTCSVGSPTSSKSSDKSFTPDVDVPLLGRKGFIDYARYKLYSMEGHICRKIKLQIMELIILKDKDIGVILMVSIPEL